MIADLHAFVEDMVGRPFKDVERDLVAAGFVRGAARKERPSGNTRVKFTHGHHEHATVLEVVHQWDGVAYGISRPGQVTGGNIVERKVYNDSI